ncbi:hypothetical protein [Bacillus suaedaesalsae]|uniref:DUF3899 domain-containing protein n=1 Tax=Bacillus suaedaesalsae TaxID=2810349 RepID=A0ABS2DJU0_9BACI|nr:hypothetical protein [Bacillus suaedaesalsae]MBM6618672.1 hypothetical protein [Bacillus suaedaesalsae]
MMKNVVVVMGTILMKCILLLGIAYLLGWKFIDFAILGGVALFGTVWFFQMNSVQKNNQENSYLRGMFGNDTPKVSVFRFKMNPVLIGMIVYIILSGVTTFVYYIEYF